MNTPIYDFAKKYAESEPSRMHMPAHKGQLFLGCEPFDITEIGGADELFSPDGIIAESEKMHLKYSDVRHSILRKVRRCVSGLCFILRCSMLFFMEKPL